MTVSEKFIEDMKSAKLTKKGSAVSGAVTAALEETGFYASVHTWDGSYQKNEYLEKWYKWLGLMGYSISDEEKAMLDGTHECFEKKEEET